MKSLNNPSLVTAFLRVVNLKIFEIIIIYFKIDMISSNSALVILYIT
jgi:hypothetical protein